MKKTIIALTLTLAAGSLTAGQLLEAIVVRVGDRIITRSQYQKRLAETLAEMEANTPPEQHSARRAEIRQRFADDLISELLIKDRADRLGITVSEQELKEAV